MNWVKKTCMAVLLMVFCSSCFAVSDEEIAKIKAAAPAKATRQPAKPRTVLVFSLCKGFKHSSIPYWDQALVAMGEKTGAYKATVSYDINMLKPENLHKFDALVLNNTTHLKLKQEDPVIQTSIMDFLKGGKGVMGIHAASDNFYDWPEMQEIMGGKFTGHPWNAGDTVAVKLDDPDHPLLKVFAGKGFKVKDEIYLTDPPLYSRQKARVLMSLDMSDARTAGIDGGKHKNKDVGITWVKSVGKGRLFYGSLGHNNDLTWWTPLLQHYLDGLQFALGDLDVDTTPIPLPQGLPPAAVDTEALKDILTEVSAYDYGKSREALTQLSDFIRGIEGTDHLRIVEKQLLEFLQSQATLASKQFVCSNLSIIGSELSAQVLAGMLVDPETSDMARYALERIPGEGVDVVLRDTLGRTKGVEKVGVISTLGLRGDAKSVPILAQLIADADAEVASAAVAALGQIAGAEARAALAKAKDATTGDLQMLVLDAYLNCADGLIDAGQNEEALMIYRELYSSNIPQVIRSAALRGTVYSIPDKAGEIILEVIKAGDPAMQEIAFGLVGEIREDAELQSLAGQLSNLAPAGQVQLITALANRGSAVAKDAVVASVASDIADVRVAAYKALASLGDKTTVALLAEAAGSAIGAERLAARESLYSMRDPEVDATILQTIDSAPEAAKVELIRSISQRNIQGAMQTLLKTAVDPSAKVQLESYKTLQTAAGPDELETLVGLLAGVQNSTVRSEAERTAAAAAARIEDKTRKTAPVIAAFEKAADPTVKASLLSVLGRIGEDNAFLALYMGLKDDNAAVKESAIKAISGWPNSKPADALLEIATNAGEPKQRILALRGYVALASLDAKTNPTGTIARFRKAMDIAAGITEKRMVLAGIATVKEVAALDLAVEYMQEKTLAPEAQAAVIGIASGIAEQSPQLAKAALAKVLDLTTNDVLRRQAQETIDRMDGKSAAADVTETN
ncbi:MAG: ThuA domain-containing protein [Phycisphaerae bacterium]|nr:ThuA domain-containing protein [Phycisphaerae bacterium]